MKKQLYPFKAISGIAVVILTAMLSLNINAQNIIGQPKDVTVFEGHALSVFFIVDVSPDAKLEFQWFRKLPGEALGKELLGETKPVLEVPFAIPATIKSNGYGYYCTVSGELKEESLHAYLWVQPMPKVQVIIGQPKDVTEEVGYSGEINFNVELTAGVKADIIWFKRDVGTIPEWLKVGFGPQFTELVKELDPRMSGTAYRCLVGHEFGEEYSEVAYLWAKEPKKLIRTEPVDVTKPEGFIGTINFDITPTYIESIFQWQYKFPEGIWTDVIEGVKPTLEFPIKEMSSKYNGMAFRCIVRFKDITEVSETAYLHLEEVNKFILMDPEDVMVKQGFSGDLYFAIKYDDSYKLAFQWQERKPGGSWVDISSVYFPTDRPELFYPVEKLTSDWNGWSFRCVATNMELPVEVEYSGEANLYVSLYETYFLGHPRNVSICEGAEGVVKYAVKMVPDVKLSLQWQVSPADDKNWYDIKGADSTVYVKEFTQVPLSYNGYAYRCKAVDSYGGTEFSDMAFLYVTALPKITSHPASQEKMVGEAVTFNVMATGAKPFYYQWKKDGAPLSGAVASSLSLFPLSETDIGDYTVIVSNACIASGDTSNAATLVVNAPEFGDGWFEQEIVTSKKLTDIKFTGTNSGWVTVSPSNFMYKTVDGGKTWDQESIVTSMDWEAVFTTDASHVWIAGEDSIKYSSTGGGTWIGGVMNSVVSAINLYDLYFTDNSNGWAVGDNGLILHSSDGGANWSEQHSGDKLGFVTDANLSAVHFYDSDSGWVVGNQGIILFTQNGGLGWATQAVGLTTNKLKDVHFISSKVGWAVGGDDVIPTGQSVILKTINGGANWTVISTQHSIVGNADLTGVYFFDENHGWLTTSDGQILRTNDGGTSWYSQATGTTETLNAIDFANYDNGWVVGNIGTILRTAYSGCLLPKVSLFEDKEFCASVAYELVADTFASNVDCSYEWSTGETSGSIIADTSAKYYVTVTSVCGEQVSDTVNIVLYSLPNPYAGSNQEICYGDSVQLLATGGVGYSWNNAGFLDDSDVQNPKAGPPEGSTDFIVTVTDENLCENTDTVNVTVYPIPTSTFAAPDANCVGDAAAIIYAGSASANANFYWSFDKRYTVLSGDSIGPYDVSWDTAGVYSIELVVEENGCSSDTSKADLAVHPFPVSDFSLQAAVCGSDEVEVVYTGTVSLDADFVWDFDGAVVSDGDETGPGPIKLTWATPGTKNLNLNVSDNGCAAELTEKDIVVSYPYNEQIICLVSVDLESGKNAIMWEKGDHPGVEFYRIYRERATGGGVYDPIATLPADTLSYYVDNTSAPESKSHKYRISVIDTCSNESDASLYHKSMLLTTNLGTDRINVSWTEYEVEKTGFGFQYYIIYRGPAADELVAIDTIPADNTLYPDINPPEGNNYYQVAGVVANACSPSGNYKAGTGPYSHSLSNLDDNKLRETSTVNNAPSEIAMEGVSVQENSPVGTLIGRLTTTDIDTADTPTYTLVAGAGDTDNGSFVLQGDSLLTAGVFDYELKNSYTIRVRTTDDGEGNLFFEKQFSIQVVDVTESVNQAPTDISLNNITISEAAVIGSVVGRFSASDPDLGDSHSYSFVLGSGDTDNGSFVLKGDSLLTAGVFDYELKNSYTVRVRTTDDGEGNLFFEKTFTVAVLDEDETGIGNPEGSSLKIYPNPFMDKLRVEYRLQNNSSVKIEVFNILGVRILELVNREQTVGIYNYDIMSVDLDGSSIYYLRFAVDGKTTVKKLVPAK